MSSRKGWVKAHRSFLDWEWMRKGHSFKVMMALVFKANYEPNTYQGTLVDRGSLIIGRDLFASELGISVQQLRTILRNLESTGEITTKSSRKGTIVTVVRYEDYQASTNESTSKPTAKPTPPATTLKEVEEEKNTMSDEAPLAEDCVLALIEEEVDAVPTIEEEAERVWGAYPSKSGKKAALPHIKRAVKKHGADWLIEKIQAYKIAYDNMGWSYKNGSTYFNQDSYDDELPTPPKVANQQSFADQRADASNPFSPNYQRSC